ncbi:MAG: tetratricopeptide repeat protein [Acidobacteria bacterium]|nr:tetratricopeptide repeat protein [Acidobacteriota bacterium]MBV9068038.1 tetratricopeptide repeat protein [Acidobacteriota bacterium]MBV9185667.1 tetratricopeptide repeat protein [Acidobacteriota bacterium]
MKRETIIFTACGFLLGLTLGSFVIGPKIAQSKLAGAPVAADAAPVETPPTASDTAAGNPMGTVMQQLASLKAAVAKNPNDADALVQLGDMYMQAAKFPQAAEYLQRALAVRDDAAVRMDLGICYKQTNQPEKALAEFQRSAAMAPDQWQPLFNEAIALIDLHRPDEARVIAAKLQKMRPDDPEVQKLVATVGGK